MSALVNCPCHKCGCDTLHIGRICSECGEPVPVCPNAILPDARPAGCRRPEAAKAHRQRISKLAGAAFARSRHSKVSPAAPQGSRMRGGGRL